MFSKRRGRRRRIIGSKQNVDDLQTTNCKKKRYIIFKIIINNDNHNELNFNIVLLLTVKIQKKKMKKPIRKWDENKK